MANLTGRLRSHRSTALGVAARTAVVAAVYFLAGKVSLLLAIPPGIASPVWIPSGIALAAVLRWGRNIAPGIWVGSFLVNIGILLDQGGPPAWAVASGIATGSTLQALVGATLIQRSAHGEAIFDSTRGTFRFIGAALLACLVAPGIGAASLYLGGLIPLSQLPLTWLTWWLGDLVGILVVSPVFLIAWRVEKDQLPEAILLGSALITFGALIFGGQMLPTQLVTRPVSYIFVLPVIWAAFRFGQSGVVATSLLVSAIAIRGTIQAAGYATATTNESLLLLQAFIGLITLTGLLMAAALTERRQAGEALRLAHDELEIRIRERTVELSRANATLQSEVEQHERTANALRRSRDELANFYQGLQELDRLKSKFISDVSHELRTPVTNMLLYLDLIETGKPEKRKQYEAALRDQVARFADLIEGISNLSRLQEEQVGVAFGTVDLNGVVDLVVNELQPRAVEAGLTLTFDPGRDPLLVRGAADQLRQVAVHLLKNAIDYTPAGNVLVTTGRYNNFVYLRVGDTGRGIDPVDMGHVFERFYRGRGVSHIPGSGLGLAVVDRVIRMHGGTVEMESRAGEGTTLTINLPVSDTQQHSS